MEPRHYTGPAPIRRLAFLLAVAAAVGSVRRLSHGALDLAAACQARKLHQTGRHARALLSCHSLATAQGALADAACESAAETQLSGSFAKAEEQGDCATKRDAAAVRRAIDDAVDALSRALGPAPAGSACRASKLSAAGEYLSRTLELYAKQRTNRNDMRLSQGDLYAAMKLDRAFEAAERGPRQTTRDFNAVLARLENLTGDLVENLWPLSALGVSFSRPVGWHLNPFYMAAGGDIELNNFSNAYIHGGIRPPGGAAIFVAQDETRTPSLRTLAEGDARQEDATIDSILEVLVGDESALRAR